MWMVLQWGTGYFLYVTITLHEWLRRCQGTGKMILILYLPSQVFSSPKKTTFIMYHIFILVTSWMCQNITAHRVNGGSSLANTLFLACLLYVLSYLLVIFFQGILKQLYFSKNSCLKVCFCYRLYIHCVVVTNAAYS